MKDLFPAAEKAQTPKSIPTFYWVLVALIIAVIGVGLYFSFLNSSGDNEAPPSLSLEGAGYQGFLTDDRGFYEFDESDVADMELREAGLIGIYGASSERLSQPDKRAIYYYLDEEGSQSFEDTLDLVQAEVGNKCLVVTYLENEFKIYPDGPYVGTKTVTPAYEVPAGTPFSLVCRDGYDTWKINSGDIQPTIDYVPLNEMDSTWNLTIFDSSEALATEVKSCGNRVVSVWTQNGLYMNDFVQVDRANPILQSGYHLAWFKLTGDAGTCEEAALPAFADDESKDEGKELKLVTLDTLLKDPAVVIAKDPVLTSPKETTTTEKDPVLVAPKETVADKDSVLVSPKEPTTIKENTFVTTKEPVADEPTTVKENTFITTKEPVKDGDSAFVTTKEPVADSDSVVVTTKEPVADSGDSIFNDVSSEPEGDAKYIDDNFGEILVPERTKDLFDVRGDTGFLEDIIKDSITTTDTAVDERPSGVEPFTVSPAVASVKLNWKEAKDDHGIKGYKIKYAITGTSKVIEVMVSPSAVSHTLKGLSPVPYIFAVSAIDTAGQEGPISSYSAVPLAPVDNTTVDVVDTTDTSTDTGGDGDLPTAEFEPPVEDGFNNFGLPATNDFLGTTVSSDYDFFDGITAESYETQLVEELAKCDDFTCRRYVFRKFGEYYFSYYPSEFAIPLSDVWDSCADAPSQLKCMDDALMDSNKYPHQVYEDIVYQCVFEAGDLHSWDSTDLIGQVDPDCLIIPFAAASSSLSVAACFVEVGDGARDYVDFSCLENKIRTFLKTYACPYSFEGDITLIDYNTHVCTDTIYVEHFQL